MARLNSFCRVKKIPHGKKKKARIQREKESKGAANPNDSQARISPIEDGRRVQLIVHNRPGGSRLLAPPASALGLLRKASLKGRARALTKCFSSLPPSIHRSLRELATAFCSRALLSRAVSADSSTGTKWGSLPVGAAIL